MPDPVVIAVEAKGAAVIVVFDGKAVDQWERLPATEREELGRSIGLMCAGDRPDGLQDPWGSKAMVCPGRTHQAIFWEMTSGELAVAVPTPTNPQFASVAPMLARLDLPARPLRGFLIYLIEEAREY